jgi:hypothetical protein
MLWLFGRADLSASVVSRAVPLVTTGNEVRSSAAVLADRILCDAAAARIIHSQDWEALLLCRRAKRFRRVYDEAVSAARQGGAFGGPVAVDELDRWIAALNRWVASPREKIDFSRLSRMSQDQRIAMLVDRLDESSNPPTYFVGEQTPASDTPVHLLVREGDAGIESLIGAIDDSRMARWSTAAFLRQSGFESVGEVAARFVEGAMGITGFGGDSVQRKEQMSRVWEKVRGRPIEERWLIALEDDSLSPLTWHYAANALSAPAWTEPSGTGGISMREGLPAHFTGVSLRCATLYKKDRRRVRRALEERIRQLAAVERPNTSAIHDMVIGLAAWDTKRAVPYLRNERARILTEPRTEDGGLESRFLAQLAEVVTALVLTGVGDAWDGYEEALATSQPSRATLDLDEALAPIWQHPDDPVARRIAGKIFRSDSAWSASRNTISHIGYFSTLLMYLPEFQLGLIEGLKDQSALTTAVRTSERAIRYEVPYRPNASYGGTIRAETASVPVGGEIPLRACDLVMEKIKTAMRMDGYDLALPADSRDAWIARAVTAMSSEGFVWPQGLRSMPVHDPVFVSRAIWPAPFSRIRPGTFVRGGG